MIATILTGIRTTPIFPLEATTRFLHVGELPKSWGEGEREKSISCLVEVMIMVMVLVMVVVLVSLDHLPNLTFV